MGTGIHEWVKIRDEQARLDALAAQRRKHREDRRARVVENRRKFLNELAEAMRAPLIDSGLLTDAERQEIRQRYRYRDPTSA